MQDVTETMWQVKITVSTCPKHPQVILANVDCNKDENRSTKNSLVLREGETMFLVLVFDAKSHNVDTVIWQYSPLNEKLSKAKFAHIGAPRNPQSFADRNEVDSAYKNDENEAARLIEPFYHDVVQRNRSESEMHFLNHTRGVWFQSPRVANLRARVEWGTHGANGNANFIHIHYLTYEEQQANCPCAADWCGDWLC